MLIGKYIWWYEEINGKFLYVPMALCTIFGNVVSSLLDIPFQNNDPVIDSAVRSWTSQ